MSLLPKSAEESFAIGVAVGLAFADIVAEESFSLLELAEKSISLALLPPAFSTIGEVISEEPLLVSLLP